VIDSKTYSGFVAIVGKPNVGKSTLLNAMLTVKVAPTSPRPQTTRKQVRGIHTEGDRQVIFVDTPGWHEAADAMSNYMIHQITTALSEVNVILWVVDLRHPPTREDELVARGLKSARLTSKVLLVGNKSDIAKRPEDALRAYSSLYPDAETRILSAQDIKEPANLLQEVLALLPEGPFFYPVDFARSDQTPEEWAAEIVREEAMKRVTQEIPYAIATKTEEFELRENGMYYINTMIYVERDAHKPILIGEKGRKIKEIGASARKQLEVFLSAKVYLELKIKVYPNWRRDPEALRELGYD
jgi:GTPase